MIGAALAVVRRPLLWPTAWRQYRRTVPHRWWRRAPFLPVPRRDYVRFRLLTQYGGTGGLPDDPARAGHDVVSYLRWCRQWERVA